ncbi:hypothetical protein Lalb_Chr12g0207411 [Lupinus albus]|uniref:Uncharacterized protein n=1 Tax=Lupinus albus TaxID=3870 RepID=A0A6A4PNU1_LUPAL|nr:hypothetical protein Lalb_Chr12g0207411 [Lupinus albus]
MVIVTIKAWNEWLHKTFRSHQFHLLFFSLELNSTLVPLLTIEGIRGYMFSCLFIDT